MTLESRPPLSKQASGASETMREPTPSVSARRVWATMSPRLADCRRSMRSVSTNSVSEKYRCTTAMVTPAPNGSDSGMVITNISPGWTEAKASCTARLSPWPHRTVRAGPAARLPGITEIRQIGLWIGIDIVTDAGPARLACEELASRRVLCKDTHEQTSRIAPPLTATEAELDWALERTLAVLAAM